MSARVIVPLLLFLTALPPYRLTAQTPRLTVTGRLLRIHGPDTTLLAGQWVVAHRIGPRIQGPVDSVRSDSAGRFAFRLPQPDSGDVIVLSSRHDGLGYFSEPVDVSVGQPPTVVLAVFDTSTTGEPLRVGIHHVVVTRERNGARRVLDIFQVENTGQVTRVGPDSTAAVWSAALPDGIESPSAGEGDIAPSTIRFEGGKVLVSAPFPPGLKQVVITYDLKDGARTLVVPVDQPTERLEMFVEDSTATASADLLSEDPVTIEGRVFRRYSADSLAAGARPSLNLAGAASRPRDTTWIVVTLAALAMASTALWAVRRRKRLAPANEDPAPVAAAGGDADLAGESVERLAAMIAALEDRFAGKEHDTAPDAWQVYLRRRAALKAELAQRLARA